MDCPRCGKRMENGYLVGANVNVPLFWLPEEHKDSFFLYTDDAVWKRNGLVFEKEVLERPLLETHICRSCGIGMITFHP